MVEYEELDLKEGNDELDLIETKSPIRRAGEAYVRPFEKISQTSGRAGLSALLGAAETAGRAFGGVPQLPGEARQTLSQALLGELSPLERGAYRAGGQAALTFGLGGSPGAAALAAGGGLLGQAVEEGGGGPIAQAVAEISPLVIAPYASAKLLATGEAGPLIRSGKALGMTNAEIAPLIRGEGAKKAAFSTIASKSTRTKMLNRSFKGLERATDRLSQEARRIGEVSPDIKSGLMDDLAELRVSITSDPYISARSKKGLKILEETAAGIGRSEPTGQSLYNAYRNLNRDYRESPYIVSEINKKIGEALKKASPQFGEEFDNTNKLWRSFYALKKANGKAMGFNPLDHAEAYAAIYALAKREPGKLASALESVAGRTAFTKAMLGPRMQKATEKLARSFADNKPAAAAAALQSIESELYRVLEPNEDLDLVEIEAPRETTATLTRLR